MSRFYLIDVDHNITESDSVDEWGQMFEDDVNLRRVAENSIGGCYVSTVFLGMDHGFLNNDEGPPVLFETMIFGGPLDDFQSRYYTWDEAEKGHDAVCAKLKEELKGEWIWMEWYRGMNNILRNLMTIISRSVWTMRLNFAKRYADTFRKRQSSDMHSKGK